MHQNEIQQQYYSNLERRNSTDWFFYSNQSDLDEGNYSYFGCFDNTTGDGSCTGMRNVLIEVVVPSTTTITPQSSGLTGAANIRYVGNNSPIYPLVFEDDDSIFPYWIFIILLLFFIMIRIL